MKSIEVKDWVDLQKRCDKLESKIKSIFYGFFAIDKRDFEARSEFMMKKYNEVMKSYSRLK